MARTRKTAEPVTPEDVALREVVLRLGTDDALAPKLRYEIALQVAGVLMATALQAPHWERAASVAPRNILAAAVAFREKNPAIREALAKMAKNALN